MTADCKLPRPNVVVLYEDHLRAKPHAGREFQMDRFSERHGFAISDTDIRITDDDTDELKSQCKFVP